MGAPDLSWEAMVEVCGYSAEVTKTERGRINAALKELRAIYPASTDYAIHVDIKARADVYRRKFPGMELTPQALVGNWSRLDPHEERAVPSAVEGPPAHCGTCDNDKVVLVGVRADGSEEYTPCPDCHPNRMAAGYWRYDRTRANPPDAKKTREMMLRLLEGDENG